MPNDPRLNQIEERIAWIERHLAEQDRAMLELGEENARLRKQLALLQARVTSSALPGEASLDTTAEERPPHY